jgi:hypothetical protein
MNSSSSSSASSVAVASSCVTVATSVAIRRSSPCRFSWATFAPIPYRASSASRRGVALASSRTRDRPDPMISATRFNALTICGPDARAGPVRHSSGGDTRAPGSTTSNASNAARS